MKLLLIALGGALGALARYALSGLVYAWLGPAFPWGTLVVNLTGCYGLGLLWALSEAVPLPGPIPPLVFVGFFGAFTTFSTYGLESFNLLRDGELVLALLNLLGSSLAGLLCVALGFLTARLLLHLGGMP
ncbi:fluoride efflux transporter CrcB [Rhodothermus marinus]|uniref:Fluoride-specific ion channel FluC n=1 Tax=Rhodothermus marinus (strain ATCC 43812 / DSM 4252 / R-10) TaxID=518766 RepID=D0MH17_RHOM4|nr:fluoride efflux transporter CrcB [Rhodothermus marinus]ACY47802.1 CrcB protein [Rhodothermus marinus DSM 4252]